MRSEDTGGERVGRLTCHSSDWSRKYVMEMASTFSTVPGGEEDEDNDGDDDDDDEDEEEEEDKWTNQSPISDISKPPK